MRSHHRRHRHREDTGRASFLLRFGLLALLVLGVGGATWIALTPYEVVQRDVIIPIDNARFKD